MGMKDLYNELMVIDCLLESSKYDLENLQKYYSDITEKSFISTVDYMYEEVCLENMSYPDYSKNIAQNLKHIVVGLNEEIANYDSFIQSLLKVRKHLLNKIMVASILPAAELMDILKLFGYQPSLELFAALRYIQVFTLKEDTLDLSEELCMNFPADVIEFILFYVSAKGMNLKERVEDIYSNYQTLKDEKTL